MEPLCDVREARDEQGAVVLVHGAGEHFGRYEWLCGRLNENGYSVYGGDLPGYGRTAGKRGHIDRFTDYFTAVDVWIRAAEKRGRPLYILGHSMGGLVSIRYAMERNPQVNGMILSSPCLKLYRNVSASLETLVSILNRTLPSIQFASGIRPDDVSRSPEVRKRVTEDPYYSKKVSVRWYKELRQAMETATKETERFPDLPLLVLQAGQDRVVQAEASRQWAEQVTNKDKQYIEWPGLYHELFNEPEKEAVFLQMLQWMTYKNARDNRC